MKIMKLVSLGFLSLSLVSCSILPAQQVSSTYRLPPSQVRLNVPHIARSIAVLEPQAPRIIAHERLVVVMEDKQMLAYEGVRWEDALQKLFQQRLMKDLQTQKLYQTVLNSDEQIKVDRRLRLELRDYQIEYEAGEPYVLISGTAHLLTHTKVMASHAFYAKKSLKTVKIQAVLDAFAQANDEINTQIIAWLMEKETS